MGWTQEKINEVYAEVQEKAMTNEEFREELLNNTNEAIEKVAGEKLPEGFQVKVVESDPAYAATFVLPDLMSDELDTEELEAVSGGVVSFALIISACAAAVSIQGCAANACGGHATVELK